jgi:teichoic acid transport system ATP-binding protein
MAAESRRPTVVADSLDVVFRVVVSGASGNAVNALRGIFGGSAKESMIRRVHAVKGVSFVAYEGDAIGLVGRNGSGKSTLLRAVAGLIPAEPTGAVYTSGQPTLLGVNAALMRDLTGERNIILGCLAMGMTKEEAFAAQDSIAEFADIGDSISLPMRTYSSGMGARLRFAIAAAKSHEILMIDEALATGDAEFRRRSEERIAELREAAGTVFLVSHSLGVVRTTCNRAIWLHQGEIAMDGPVEEVLDAYEEKFDPAKLAKRVEDRKRALGGG